MKHKYICKCGKEFTKETNAATTGFRLGLNFEACPDCKGCHFIVPIEEGWPNAKVVDHECRASKRIDYHTSADIPRSRESFHVARVYTLDMDFARQVWEYSHTLGGLDDSRTEMDLRGVLYLSDGRYELGLFFAKTKAGIASCIKVSDKFFAGGSSRPGVTEEQEKAAVLQQIRRSKEAAKHPTAEIQPAAPGTVSNDVQSSRSIDQITLEINFYKRQTAQNILEIGKRLIEAKRQLQHGEWLPWLRDKVQFSEISAQRFMRIAQEFSNPSPVTDLPYTKLLALLQVPESDREEFIQETHLVDGQEKTVADMSKRELEQAIKERDEAREKLKGSREAADFLRNENKQVRDRCAEVQTMRESAENRLKAIIGDRQADLKKITELEQQVQDLASRPVEVAVHEPDETAKERLRREGAVEVRRQYEQQLEEARRQLEEAKDQARQDIGLERDEIVTAAVSFQDSLDAVCDNFKLILRLSPASVLEQVSRQVVDHMRGLVHELADTAAMVQNASLMDQDFSLPPEDGREG